SGTHGYVIRTRTVRAASIAHPAPRDRCSERRPPRAHFDPLLSAAKERSGMRTKRRSGMADALAFALLLVGCGGSDDEPIRDSNTGDAAAGSSHASAGAGGAAGAVTNSTTNGAGAGGTGHGGTTNVAASSSASTSTSTSASTTGGGCFIDGLT